ncbi:MAG: GTPase Era [Clostridia bacterium]|nr:GTPase Era [Clostridia bacterium]
MELTYGIVGIVGKPNVGKSSLLNAIIREKVSIVSPKPQTTRDNVMGIYNDDDSQIVFVDTPGIFQSDSKLGDYMNRNVASVASDVDVLLVLVDGTKEINQETVKFVSRFKKENVILVVTKTDLTNFEKLYPKLSVLNELDFVIDIIPISSHKLKNVDVLLKVIKENLPKGDESCLMFERDMYTNKSVKFLASEIIREKILLALDDEVPHGVAISIVKFEEEGNLARIYADIICERDSHKGIILGKGGQMLKKIGQNARIEIEKMLEMKVFLEIFVKVKNNWKNSLALLSEIGYNNSEDY